jgi:hypothetical protein
MAPPVQPQPEPKAAGTPAMLTWVSVFLIVVFIGSLGLLVFLRSAAPLVWDRLVYLLTGLESLVFSAAGVLFGTTIQRPQVAAARRDAAQARAEADSARTRAESAGTAAAETTAKAHALRDSVLIQAAADETADPARAGLQPGAAAPVSRMRELATLAERLFP